MHYKNRELQRRAEQLSRFASELTLAEQRERNRLAKVLHDHLQQLLVAAKLGLHGLSQSITDEEVAGGIKDVYELNKQSIDTSRSLTVGFRRRSCMRRVWGGLEYGPLDATQTRVDRQLAA